MLSRDPRYPEDRLVVSTGHAGSYDGRFAPGESTGVPAEEPEGGGELAKRLRVIRKRKGTILVCAFLGGLAALLIELPKTPVYRATVSLAVEAQNDDFLYNKDISPNSTITGSYPDIEMATQARFLSTRALQNRVIQKLNADKSVTITVPEDRLSAWRKALHLPAAQPESRESLLRQAAGSVRVKAVLATRAIDVSADSTDPTLAATFANAMANEYIAQSLETRWQSARRTSDWLSTQLDDMKVKLQKSEEDLQHYAAAVDLVLTSDKNKDNIASDKLRQLQTQLSEAQADLAGRQARYELAMTSPPDSLAQVLDDASLRNYDVKLTELRREMAELSSTMTPANYKVQKVKSQIDEMEAGREKARGLIVERIHNDFEEGARREKLLSSALARQAAVVTDQSGKIIHYDILQHDVDSNRQLYESLLQRVKESGISSALRASNIQVIDPATTPEAPFAPNVPLGVVMGLLAGLGAGVGLVIVQDRMNPCIERPGDAEFYLGIPELGAIPSWSLDRRTGTIRKDPLRLAIFKRGSGALESGPKSYSSYAEAFRLLLTSILFAGRHGKTQVLVVTSPSPSEGKSTVVSNLAAAYAETGRSVLVIDCDMARPRQHEILAIPNESGLGALLAQTDSLDARSVSLAIRGTQLPGVNVLPFGDPEGGASANLLHSKRFPELIDLARERFDVVLIDTPPMLYMADSRIVGSLADGVVLVIRARRTMREAAVKAARQLAADGVPVLGVALNDWNPKFDGYYSSYDYARYYAKRQ